jgi:flagellar M-ring protein FliF
MVSGILKPAGAAPGAALAGPGGATGAAALAASSEQMQRAGEDMRANVELARIKGDIRDSSLKQVQEIIEQHPEESAAILRGYLSNAA